MEVPNSEGEVYWRSPRASTRRPIPFPFHAYFVDKDACFARLQAVEPVLASAPRASRLNPVAIDLRLDTLNGSLMLAADAHAWEIDRLTLVYSEYSLNHARIKGRPSVAEFWAANAATRGCSPEAANEAIYKRMGKQVGTYSLTRAVALYKLAQSELKAPLRILDISAGWGDRMIAAAAVGACYLGVDPNARNEPAYRAIAELAPPGQLRYQLARAEDLATGVCAEDLATGVCAEDERFNLVFSCPPYFNKEIYAEDASQSVTRLPSLDVWFAGFLLVALANAWALLEPGGLMMITISNYPGEPDYVGRLTREFHPESYRGALCYNPKMAYPVLIWRK